MSICTTTLLLLSLPCAEPDYRVKINSYGPSKRYSVTITVQALKNAPVWKKDAESPPVSPRRALQLAAEMKDKLGIGDADWKWEFESASLKHVDGDAWYWQVSYEGRNKGDISIIGIAPFLRLVVLMDGTVVKPVVTDDKK